MDQCIREFIAQKCHVIETGFWVILCVIIVHLNINFFLLFFSTGCVFWLFSRARSNRGQALEGPDVHCSRSRDIGNHGCQKLNLRHKLKMFRDFRHLVNRLSLAHPPQGWEYCPESWRWTILYWRTLDI